jgi:hypothetical protein
MHDVRTAKCRCQILRLRANRKRHHRVLSTRFVKEEGGWLQMIGEGTGKEVLSRVELGWVSEPVKVMERMASRLQGSLNIERGPLRMDHF